MKTSFTMGLSAKKGDNSIVVNGDYNFVSRHSFVYFNKQPLVVLFWEKVTIPTATLTVPELSAAVTQGTVLTAVLEHTATKETTDSFDYTVQTEAAAASTKLTLNSTVTLSSNQTATISGGGIADGTTITADGSSTVTLSTATTSDIVEGVKVVITIKTTTEEIVSTEEQPITVLKDAAEKATSLEVSYINKDISGWQLGSLGAIEVSTIKKSIGTKITLGGYVHSDIAAGSEFIIDNSYPSKVLSLMSFDEPNKTVILEENSSN